MKSTEWRRSIQEKQRTAAAAAAEGCQIPHHGHRARKRRAAPICREGGGARLRRDGNCSPVIRSRRPLSGARL